MPVTPGVTTTNGNLAEFKEQYWSNKALDVREKKFQFRRAADKDTIPLFNGRIVSYYRPENFTNVNTNETVEGVPGVSMRPRSKGLSIRLGQFANNITFSDASVLTAKTPIVENAVGRFGYFLGEVLDLLTRRTIDNESAGCTYTLDDPDNYMRLKELRGIRHVLANDDVEPGDGMDFWTFMSPYGTFDLLNDPDNTSIMELAKYTMPDKAGLTKYEDRGTVARISGHHIIESTNVLETAGSPNLYRSYHVGKGAFSCIDLSGHGPGEVIDPKKQKFRIKVRKSVPDSAYDPENKIAAYIAYNIFFGTGVLEGGAVGGSYRMRIVDHASSLG